MNGDGNIGKCSSVREKRVLVYVVMVVVDDMGAALGQKKRVGRWKEEERDRERGDETKERE